MNDKPKRPHSNSLRDLETAVYIYLVFAICICVIVVGLSLYVYAKSI